MQPLPHRIARPLLTPLLVLALCACVNPPMTIPLGEHFYKPLPSQEAPFPLSVAIRVDETVKSPHEYFVDKIILHPGLSNALQAELATVFKQVRLIDSSSQAKGDRKSVV